MAVTPYNNREVGIKGFVIAGVHSGCGKTTVSLGMMAALKQRGLTVAPFKVGPDFIDPGHHGRITGTTSRNLDGWMLSRHANADCFDRHAAGADVAVVEGVMGLFDGYDGGSDAGSSAQMAKWLNLPVLLVVNAKSMARSAAALLKGFEWFDQDLRFAGVIFNMIGSQRHLTYLKEAVEGHVTMPCLGGICRDEDMSIPERHLGLVTRQDHDLTPEYIDRLVGVIERNVDVDALLAGLPDVDVKPVSCRPATDFGRLPNRIESSTGIRPGRRSGSGDRPRIGVARDNAFCFYYQDNLDMLQSCEAEPVFFSPVRDRRLPRDLDGLYLGGGYPELFAAQLAENSGMRRQIREKSMDGMPIYGECGGFMYLCRQLTDADGNVFPMTGCFPYAARMFSRLKALGYREITLTRNTVIGPEGRILRGHEFHYSALEDDAEGASNPSIEYVYRVTARAGLSHTVEGCSVFNTLGSYIHLHFGSCPQAAEHFTARCIDYQLNRKHTL